MTTGRTMIRPRPGFKKLLLQTGTSLRSYADRAGVAVSTLHAWEHPSTQPGRKGGVQEASAWRVANYYAELQKIEPTQAFDLLFEEQQSEEADQHKAEQGE